METLKAIAKRKSTRAFLPDKQISKESLNTILSAGCAAPVGMSDYSSIHLTVIQNRELLEKISQTAQDVMKININFMYGAPTFVLISASEKQKAPNVQYSNIACVIENMLLAATDIGVDSVYLWGGLTIFAENIELCKELGIPDGFSPVSGVALGYALENNPTEKELGVTMSINYI